MLAHETGHTFGLPDLYVYGQEWPALHAQVGAWDLMGDLGPGLHPLTWHKLKLGWLDAARVRCLPGGRTGDVDVVASSQGSTGVASVVAPVSGSEAYVVEVRTKSGLDAGMCDPDGGVLIYRVNANTAGGRGPVKVLPASTDSTPGCGPLSLAPYDAGEAYSNDEITVDVLGMTSDGYTVRVSNHSPPPCPAGTSSTVVCRDRAGGGMVMVGTGRGESFAGTGSGDVIRGLGGADTLLGRGGADRLIGGPGRDRFSGGGQKDTIDASGQRRERVSCGGGRDRVVGARGDRVRRDCERVRR